MKRQRPRFDPDDCSPSALSRARDSLTKVTASPNDAPPVAGPYLQTVSGRWVNPFEPDPAQLEPIVRAVVASSPKPVADYRAGKTAALEALLGKVMGQTRGQADPDVARELLEKAVAK